ncbi:MAG TPA: hypothetical protein PLB90_12520, partial [Opitutaceae bacterium]|nr:hypothetical protein [Opitutaceae bacterium]
AIPVGIVVAILLIALTAPRGGLPLWMRLWLNLRGSILLAAAENPSGMAAEGTLGASQSPGANLSAGFGSPRRTPRQRSQIRSRGLRALRGLCGKSQAPCAL